MKILSLRFKNLNSLYGEWVIDFTNEEYTSNGIFAITGQTGAGKSTILDAICLALYGSTPRLNLITKSSNEIMSRQTGECYAEVTFKVNDGVYKCHWSQHRSRKKADGKLADSIHEISDVNTGKVLESKKKEVAKVVIEKTGMDLDRFTRSMLLAQGGFTAFLKATADERAPILEQITGTEIYSTISIKIHERQKSENEILSHLTAETSGIIFLTLEEENLLKEEFATKTDLDDKATKYNKTLNGYINWLNNVETLKNESLILKEEYKRVKKDLDDFKPSKDRLSLANKASELDGIYTEVTGLRHQQSIENKILSENLLEIPVLKVKAKDSQDIFKIRELELSKSRENYKHELQVIEKVREFDIKIDQNINSASKVSAELEEITIRIKSNRDDFTQSKLKKDKLISEFDEVNNFLENFDYGSLSQKLGEIKLLIERYSGSKVLISQKGESIKESENLLIGVSNKSKIDQKRILEFKQSLEVSTKNIIDHKQNIENLLDGKLLREYQTQLKSLGEKRVLLAKISSLENYRTQLKDGLECPLCGSLEHPYALGNTPEVSLVDKDIAEIEELLLLYEDLDKKLIKLELDKNDIQLKLTESEKLFIKVESTQNEVKNNLEREKLELLDLELLIQDDFKKLEIELKPYNLKLDDSEDNSGIILDLSQKVFKWQTYKEKYDNFRSKSQEIISYIDSLEAVFKTEEVSRLQKLKSLEVIKKELELNQVNRKELYCDKDPTIEQKSLEVGIDEADKSLIIIREERDSISKKLIELNTKNNSLKDQISKRSEVLKDKELNFITEYKMKDFLTETDFCKYRLSNHEREILSNKDRQIETLFNNTETRTKDKESTLQKEIDKKLTNLSLQELKGEFNNTSILVKKLGEELGVIKEKLESNILAKERLNEKKEFIEKQQIEVQKWQKLHHLIGSADGKKFRNFAQGLTFELMVSHANKQLISMTDRYLLVRDKDKPLELNVIDNYQAGEERSTKNLSGGESFIISLSLALGLSSMASKRVKVDSLFLDEGFGTLDEEALETALETLSGLHQAGKLIGIISHIPALKDRISTQIQVSKGSGGRGTISGPGCKKVEL